MQLQKKGSNCETAIYDDLNLFSCKDREIFNLAVFNGNLSC